MYKNRYGINNLQWLMCHKIKPDPPQIHIYIYMYILYSKCIRTKGILTKTDLYKLNSMTFNVFIPACFPLNTELKWIESMDLVSRSKTSFCE